MANTKPATAKDDKTDSAPKAADPDQAQSQDETSSAPEPDVAASGEDSERPERISRGASQADAVRDEIAQDTANVEAGIDAAEARPTQYLVDGEVPANAPGTEGLPRE